MFKPTVSSWFRSILPSILFHYFSSPLSFTFSFFAFHLLHFLSWCFLFSFLFFTPLVFHTQRILPSFPVSFLFIITHSLSFFFLSLSSLSSIFLSLSTLILLFQCLLFPLTIHQIHPLTTHSLLFIFFSTLTLFRHSFIFSLFFFSSFFFLFPSLDPVGWSLQRIFILLSLLLFTKVLTIFSTSFSVSFLFIITHSLSFFSLSLSLFHLLFSLHLSKRRKEGKLVEEKKGKTKTSGCQWHQIQVLTWEWGH